MELLDWKYEIGNCELDRLRIYGKEEELKRLKDICEQENDIYHVLELARERKDAISAALHDGVLEPICWESIGRLDALNKAITKLNFKIQTLSFTGKEG